MASADWSNPKGVPFRYNKTIQPDPDTAHHDYPAIFSIYGKDDRDEAKRVADLVAYLKHSNVIEDFSQVALLLHSVRIDHSGSYLESLERKGIPAFCPRSRTYFENEEVRLMIGCLALIFGHYGDRGGQVSGPALQQLADYVDGWITDLGRGYGVPHPLAGALKEFVDGIEALKEGESLDFRPADYFYRLLAYEPFAGFVKNENRARNLAILSQLLNTLLFRIITTTTL
jgi:DNA helicase-2/ATP-dependent DNA helicase PcrA